MSYFVTQTVTTKTAAPAVAAVTSAFSWSQDGEEWRPAYVTHVLELRPLRGYFVSNLGRACHHRRGILPTTTCNGHVYAWFGEKHTVGSVILATWWGPPRSPGLATFFRDGNKGNPRPENLSWGRHRRISQPGVKGVKWDWEPYDR